MNTPPTGRLSSHRTRERRLAPSVTNPEDWPTVSVVMPALNEERHLAAAVSAVLSQEYPGQLDLVIAVGPSHDRTDQIARRLAANDLRVTVVENPTGRTPAGLNAALRASKGEVIVRVDGHSQLPRGYVQRAVAVLLETGADNVGGMMVPEGVTPFERAVARAMSSRIGIGGARSHVGGQAGQVETVYLGVFRRDVLDELGGSTSTSSARRTGSSIGASAQPAGWSGSTRACRSPTARGQTLGRWRSSSTEPVSGAAR